MEEKVMEGAKPFFIELTMRAAAPAVMTGCRGIFTPLVTPVRDDESPDLVSLARLVRFQLDKGVGGFWAMGTTAEFAAFDEGERAAAIRTVVEAAAGQVPVIANVSDTSTRKAIGHARGAHEGGVDAIAATPPYYFPHSQDELLEHYRAIRSAIDLPLFIYNIPQTVRVRLELQTVQVLAEEGTAAGIKDSQNDLEWFRQLTLFIREKGVEFVAFAGTRSLIDVAVLSGANGAVPSIANAFPALCVTAYSSMVQGDLKTAIEAEAQIIRLESVTGKCAHGSRNAAVIGFLKAILYETGVIDSPRLTAPLRTPTDGERRELLAGVDELTAGDVGA
jgi:4-hydroxy-tetrahydrodipicolinate synthase